MRVNLNFKGVKISTIEIFEKVRFGIEDGLLRLLRTSQSVVHNKTFWFRANLYLGNIIIFNPFFADKKHVGKGLSKWARLLITCLEHGSGLTFMN